MIFYWDLLFEELLEEKVITVDKKVKVVEGKPILAQELNEPILSFDQTRQEKNLVMDDDSPKDPIQLDGILVPHLKEAMEVNFMIKLLIKWRSKFKFNKLGPWQLYHWKRKAYLAP